MTHPNSLWTFNLQNQTSPIGASDWKHKGRQMKLMTNYFSPSSSESPEGDFQCLPTPASFPRLGKQCLPSMSVMWIIQRTPGYP